MAYVGPMGNLDLGGIKLGILEKARLFHLSQNRFFPPIQVERLSTSFTEAAKCATVALRSPSSSSPAVRKPWVATPEGIVTKFLRVAKFKEIYIPPPSPALQLKVAGGGTVRNG
ncbi:hypothetical protein AVEN_242403-1 [Araneus ventricosus]|uniref:Uncharacterized protein n=1 Tax=Araneus ventricosus TaxID=182803 RepID=A0A4Y2IWL2_ARAVE|nr:hypothetical protein AVEN_242403-1 [Araneus ventricosus]